jgi:hypothetical protein
LEKEGIGNCFKILKSNEKQVSNLSFHGHNCGTRKGTVMEKSDKVS